MSLGQSQYTMISFLSASRYFDFFTSLWRIAGHNLVFFLAGWTLKSKYLGLASLDLKIKERGISSSKYGQSYLFSEVCEFLFF